MTLRGDDDLNDYLEHYGVRGMRWGVRRTPQQLGHLVKARALKAREALAGKGKVVSNKTSKAIKMLSDKSKEKVKEKTSEFKENRAQKKEEEKSLKQVRKDLGIDPVKFNKLRKETLKSHDPEVVAKGMHTLTDSELNAKVTRLKAENEIDNLAQKRKSQKIKNRKERYDALTSNPLYKIAEGTLKESVRELGLNTLVEVGAKPVLERRVKRWNKLDKERYKKKTKAQDERKAEQEKKQEERKAARERVRERSAKRKANKNYMQQLDLNHTVAEYRRKHPDRQRDPYQIF